MIRVPIRRGVARRLGLHAPLNLRDGVTVTRHHLDPILSAGNTAEEFVQAVKEITAHIRDTLL